MQKWLFLLSIAASPALAQSPVPVQAQAQQALQTSVMAGLQRSQELDRVVPAPLRTAPPAPPDDPQMLALGGNVYIDRALVAHRPEAADRDAIRVYRRDVR
ncbi:MAG TPA: hypothetical protein VFX09_03725 [Burkholderiales bacterium]|nr:hypothetical protein [Burkholderiales bacterium]